MSNVGVFAPPNIARHDKFFGNLKSLRGIAALSVACIHCIDAS